MGNLWTNGDGLTINFDRRDVAGGVNEKPLVRRTNRSGLEQEVVVDFDFNAMATAGVAAGAEWWDEDASGGETPDKPSNAHARIPALSSIITATVFVKDAFAGATATLNIGTYEEDGTAIDVDGLVAAEAVANLTDGAVIVGAGAQVGANVGADDAFIGAHAATAGFTAGAARCVVTYQKERDS